MKANELMIGDWVQCTYWHNPHILQVYELKRVGDDELKIVVVEDALPLVFQEVYIEPIPLTAEILEKNGFTKSNIFVEWKYEEEGIYILWKPFPFLKIETENVQLNLSGCEYVHELQHALRLCGIEKTIEL